MATRSLTAAIFVAALAVARVQSQQGGQQGQQGNVCFPGEGELTFIRPDPSFPPTVREFSYSLFRTLSDAAGEKSSIMSPYSIWSVISLAYFGSRGTTEREIANTFSFINKTHTFSNWRALRFFLESGAGDAVLGIANRGYFSNSLTLNRCLSNNLFDLRFVDFSQTETTRQGINKDVSDATQGRIPELLTFLAPQTRFVLINAIFFKGTWEVQFDPKLTRPQEFFVPPGRSSGVVQMMSRVHDTVVGDAAGLNATMVELPYLNSNISMYLLLPNDPQAPLSSLVSRLTPATFNAAVQSLPTTPTPATLSVPKFKLTTRYEVELQQALARLGIRSLFDRSTSDLSGFASTTPPLAVDTIIHQATVEVNEEGTVAAAATALIDTRFGPQRTTVVTFNRPFVFLIVDKRSYIPFFIGKVTSAADLEEI